MGRTPKKQSVDTADQQSAKKSRGTRSRSGRNAEPEHEDQLDKDIDRISKTFNRSIRTTIKKHISDGERKIEGLEAQVNDLKQQLAAKANKVEDLKSAYFQRAAAGNFVGESDREVRETFSDHMDEIKGWVKKYGSPGLACQLDDSMKQYVVKQLCALPCPSASETSITAAIRQGISANILLNSLLTKHLLHKMVLDPFFFLKHADSSLDLSKAAILLWGLGRQFDLDRANVWQSQTVALFHQISAQDQVGSTKNSIADLARQLKSRRYQEFVDMFLAMPFVRSFLVAVDQSRRDTMKTELLGITSGLGNFLIKIGTRKVHIELSSFEKLGQHPFMIKNKDWKPHSCMLLDEDDTSCDGNNILLLVEPGIIAYGNEDGTHYHQNKVWHPATVIVERHKAMNGSLTPPKTSSQKPSGGSLVSRPHVISDDDDDDLKTHLNQRRKQNSKGVEKGSTPQEMHSSEENPAEITGGSRSRNSTIATPTSVTESRHERAQQKDVHNGEGRDDRSPMAPVAVTSTLNNASNTDTGSAKRRLPDDHAINLPKKPKLDEAHSTNAQDKSMAQKGYQPIGDAGKPATHFPCQSEFKCVDIPQPQTEARNCLSEQSCNGRLSPKEGSSVQPDEVVPSTESPTHSVASNLRTGSGRSRRRGKKKASDTVTRSGSRSKERSPSSSAEGEYDPSYTPSKGYKA